MSLTECQKCFAQNYSISTLKKHASIIWWENPGKKNKLGYKNGVKKTSAGYDVTKGFALYIVKNVKTRKKRNG